eukprot:scaffold1681_cov242-Prasinococcus_capsulatus_cf.AAC.3
MAVLLCEYEEDGEAVPCRPVAFILALPFMLLGMVRLPRARRRPMQSSAAAARFARAARPSSSGHGTSEWRGRACIRSTRASLRASCGWRRLTGCVGVLAGVTVLRAMQVLTIVGILLYPFALICPCGCFIELAIWLVKVPVTVSTPTAQPKPLASPCVALRCVAWCGGRTRRLARPMAGCAARSADGA